MAVPAQSVVGPASFWFAHRDPLGMADALAPLLETADAQFFSGSPGVRMAVDALRRTDPRMHGFWSALCLAIDAPIPDRLRVFKEACAEIRDG